MPLEGHEGETSLKMWRVSGDLDGEKEPDILSVGVSIRVCARTSLAHMCGMRIRAFLGEGTAGAKLPVRGREKPTWPEPVTEGESGIRRGERGNGVRAGRAHLPVTDRSSGQVGFKGLTSIQSLSPASFQKRGPRCPRVSGSLPRGSGSQVRSLKATYGLESQRRWVPRSQNSESKGPEAQPPRGGPCPSPLCILCPGQGPRQKTAKRCL